MLFSVLYSWPHKMLFGRLEIWMQRKADSSLLYDVRTTFFFLFSPAEIVKERRYRVLPFDYASVRLDGAADLIRPRLARCLE
jgi:hypothetical protein